MLLAASAVAAVGGCASFISGSGPSLRDIMGAPGIMVQNTPAPAQGYALVRLDDTVADRLASHDDPVRFTSVDVDQPRPRIVVTVGDVLQVTVFESGSGGLFITADASSRAGNFVQLPPQQVDGAGGITVPWAGTIRAAGRTPAEIQADIVGKLAQRALEPQVIVSVTERHGNEVSVLGDVYAATRFSMDASGERMLGAIARAGGPRFPAFESLVTLQRDGRADTAMLSEIAADPAQNIALQAGDAVVLTHRQRYFLAIGATGQTTTLSQLDRRFPFSSPDLTLAEAMAEAGGLQDDRANARGVFLYRFEARATIAALGLTVPEGLPAIMPTIYALDLSQPAAFFLANRVTMRSGDTIYVANAPITDLQKVLDLLLPFTQTGSFVRSTVQ